MFLTIQNRNNKERGFNLNIKSNELSFIEHDQVRIDVNNLAVMNTHYLKLKPANNCNQYNQFFCSFDVFLCFNMLVNDTRIFCVNFQTIYGYIWSLFVLFAGYVIFQLYEYKNNFHDLGRSVKNENEFLQKKIKCLKRK